MFITSRQAPSRSYLGNLWTQADALDASGRWYPLRRRQYPRPVKDGMEDGARHWEGIPPHQMEEVWEFPNCPGPGRSLRVRIGLTDIFGRTEETNSGDVEFQLPNDQQWRARSEKEEISSFNGQDWLNGELWRAAYGGDEDYVKELISQGADPNSIDSTGMSALAIACQDGRTNVVKYLLDHGVDVNGHCKGCITDRTPLIAASMENNWEILRLLVSHGADVNARGELGWTALIWAARADDVESVKFLLSKGADPNVKALDGKSIIELTGESPNSVIVKILEEAQKVR